MAKWALAASVPELVPAEVLDKSMTTVKTDARHRRRDDKDW